MMQYLPWSPSERTGCEATVHAVNVPQAERAAAHRIALSSAAVTLSGACMLSPPCCIILSAALVDVGLAEEAAVVDAPRMHRARFQLLVPERSRCYDTIVSIRCRYEPSAGAR